MDVITNPLGRPELFDALLRTASVMFLGLTVMTLSQVSDLRRMVGSLGFKKFCSWGVILPLLLLVIYAGRLPFFGFVALLMCLAGDEAARLFGLSPYYRKVFFANQLVTAAVMFGFWTHAGWLPAVYFVSTFFAAVFRDELEGGLRQAALSVVANLWTGYCLVFLARIYAGEVGAPLVTVVIGMVIVADNFAYLFGGFAKKTGIGRRPLSPNLSPNKTVAGAVGSVAGAAIWYAVFGGGLPLAPVSATVLVVLTGVAATAGDLTESLVKRTAGVKDAGGLIPYHGGMLDRIDSLLFVAPVACGFLTLHPALWNGAL